MKTDPDKQWVEKERLAFGRRHPEEVAVMRADRLKRCNAARKKYSVILAALGTDRLKHSEIRQRSGLTSRQTVSQISTLYRVGVLDRAGNNRGYLYWQD